MVGCPHGAKNTLVKNYLWLAEQRGVEVMPDRTVTEIRPLGAADGSDGYAVTSERSGMLPGRGKRTLTRPRRRRRRRRRSAPTSCCSAAASAAPCRASPTRLGELVRTNSEMILAVTVPEDYPDDLTKRVAISCSIYPDPHTHIETVTYGKAGDSMSLLYTLLVGDGTRVTRPLKLLGQILRHPVRFAKVLLAEGTGRGGRSSSSSCRRSTTRSPCARR